MFRKRVIANVAALYAVFSMTGCAAVQNQQLKNSIAEAHSEIKKSCFLYTYLPEQEATAWTEYMSVPSPACIQQGLSTTGPIPREKMTAAGCGTGEMNKRLRPISYSPKNFARLQDELRHNRQEYIEGKIDWDEFKQKKSAALTMYVKASHGGSYYVWQQCFNNVYNRVVMPNYTRKPILMQFMANASEFARDADRKHLAEEDFKIGFDKLWADLAATDQQAIHQERAESSARAERDGNALMQTGLLLMQAGQPKPVNQQQDYDDQQRQQQQQIDRQQQEIRDLQNQQQ